MAKNQIRPKNFLFVTLIALVGVQIIHIDLKMNEVSILTVLWTTGTVERLVCFLHWRLSHFQPKLLLIWNPFKRNPSPAAYSLKNSGDRTQIQSRNQRPQAFRNPVDSLFIPDRLPDPALFFAGGSWLDPDRFALRAGYCWNFSADVDPLVICWVDGVGLSNRLGRFSCRSGPRFLRNVLPDWICCQNVWL